MCWSPCVRTAVIAATLAFRTALTGGGGVVPTATRQVGRLVMAWLDRRRNRINDEDAPTEEELLR